MNKSTVTRANDWFQHLLWDWKCDLCLLKMCHFCAYFRTMRSRNPSIPDHVLVRYWKEQRDLRKLFRKYKPSEDLLSTKVDQLTHEELKTVLLYRFTRRGVYPRLDLKLWFICNGMRLDVQIRCRSRFVKMSAWKYYHGASRVIYRWPTGINYHNLTVDAIQRGMIAADFCVYDGHKIIYTKPLLKCMYVWIKCQVFLKVFLKVEQNVPRALVMIFNLQYHLFSVFKLNLTQN